MGSRITLVNGMDPSLRTRFSTMRSNNATFCIDSAEDVSANNEAVREGFRESMRYARSEKLSGNRTHQPRKPQRSSTTHPRFRSTQNVEKMECWIGFHG